MEKPFGVYIHVPFCKSKCYYCDFTSFSNKEKYIDDYFNALIKEMSIKKDVLDGKIIDTIYIGGGTPSSVNSKYIEKVLKYINDNFNVKKDAEITIEINPKTLDESKAIQYKKIGINRASVGLQAIQDNLLKKIGRIHTLDDFVKTYNILKNIGIDNINVDLMFSLPYQTINDLMDSINFVTNLDITHISLYSLILEEGTKLYDIYEKENILENDELDREMYYKARELLNQKRFKQYEISNFAKEGFISKHNFNCWRFNEFIGFGLSAGSFYESRVLKNTSDLTFYIKQLEAGNLPIEENTLLSNKDRFETYIMLGLRKNEGISIEEINDMFCINFEKKFKNAINELIDRDLIEIKEGNLKLTYDGMDFLNYVIGKFWE